ncbi:hypothetical protein FRB98_001858 [Tulasnella sp. 332]|nr:hypothetical protein FRB98_001858 [Tulasnella sp. 332]
MFYCHDWIAVESNLQILSFTIAHALVAMRVSVLWNTHPWVKTMLISLGGSYLVATLLLTNFVNKALLPTLGWQPVLNLCFGQLPRWTAWIFVPSLLFECLLFGLTVTRAIQHRRRDISVTEGVIGVLYRDGMLYFIVITGCSLFNIIVWGALRPSLVVLAKFFTFSFVNVMASRIVLNLRAQRFSNQATQFTSASSSSNSSSFPGFTFAGRLKAARQSAATRNARTERPDIWMSGERIALRGLNLGNMPLSNGRGVSESSRRHLGDCLENPHQNSEGKVDGDLESRGGTPSVWMDMDVMTDTDAEADHGME